MSAEAKAVVKYGVSLIAPSISFLHQFRPAAMIALGLILCVAWTGLLGYGLFELGKLAF